MSISITRYVDIVSGVGAGAGVAQRSLILRVFTQSSLIPAGAVTTFTELDDVATYFGTVADEYKIAQKYFGFVSKSVTTPQALSFARWNPTDIAPAIYGDTSTKSLSAFNAVSSGNLALVVDGVSVPVSGIDLSAALTLAAVATALQTAIQATANPQLVSATVAFDTNNDRFILTGTVLGTGLITCGTAVTNDLGALVGWSTAGATAAPGTAAQTAVETVSDSADNDDNFGSFVFGGSVLPVDADIVNVAQWNHGQNNKFMFCVPVTATNASTQAAATVGFSGTALTLAPVLAEHAETIPAEILAATDYTRPGASANYMFYQFANRAASVTANSDADTYDSLRVNYVGQTQSAGQKIAFYQRGYLQGGPTAALDMAVYAGEEWLKASLSANILSMFLNVPNLPANEQGRAQLLAVMQQSIDQAVENGVFAPGKQLTAQQKAYVSQVTGNAAAWLQVQAKGYWVDAQIQSYVNSNNGLTEFKAVYILVYGKNDQIRKVEGSDILI